MAVTLDHAVTQEFLRRGAVFDGTCWRGPAPIHDACTRPGASPNVIELSWVKSGQARKGESAVDTFVDILLAGAEAAGLDLDESWLELEATGARIRLWEMRGMSQIPADDPAWWHPVHEFVPMRAKLSVLAAKRRLLGGA